MPKTEVLIYAEEDGTSPLILWLDGLPEKAKIKCIVKIEQLEKKGHELRRPVADYLRDKIHELRAALNGIGYRMLYFFYKKQCVITHGIIKKGGKVPSDEIELAITRKARFEKNPMKHITKKGASHGEKEPDNKRSGNSAPPLHR